MAKHCFCGRQIPNSMRLCKEHAAEYGTDPKTWDPWLKFLVSDYQREWNAEQNSREIEDADIVVVQNNWATTHTQVEKDPDDDCDEVDVFDHDPRVTLLETFDRDGFIILRGCEGGK